MKQLHFLKKFQKLKLFLKDNFLISLLSALTLLAVMTFGYYRWSGLGTSFYKNDSAYILGQIETMKDLSFFEEIKGSIRKSDKAQALASLDQAQVLFKKLDLSVDESLQTLDQDISQVPEREKLEKSINEFSYSIKAFKKFVATNRWQNLERISSRVISHLPYLVIGSKDFIRSEKATSQDLDVMTKVLAKSSLSPENKSNILTRINLLKEKHNLIELFSSIQVKSFLILDQQLPFIQSSLNEYAQKYQRRYQNFQKRNIAFQAFFLALLLSLLGFTGFEIRKVLSKKAVKVQPVQEAPGHLRIVGQADEARSLVNNEAYEVSLARVGELLETIPGEFTQLKEGLLALADISDSYAQECQKLDDILSDESEFKQKIDSLGQLREQLESNLVVNTKDFYQTIKKLFRSWKELNSKKTAA